MCPAFATHAPKVLCPHGSYFIYGELSGCYDKIGQTEKASEYRVMFKNANRNQPNKAFNPDGEYAAG